MMSALLLPPVGVKRCYPPVWDGRAARLQGFIAERKEGRKKAAASYFFSLAHCVGECGWRSPAGGARHVIFHTAVNMRLALYFHRESFHHVAASASFSFC